MILHFYARYLAPFPLFGCGTDEGLYLRIRDFIDGSVGDAVNCEFDAATGRVAQSNGAISQSWTAHLHFRHDVADFFSQVNGGQQGSGHT